MEDKISQPMRSPKIISNNGNYVHRTKRTKISIYRNNSPIISNPNFYKSDNNKNFFSKKEYLHKHPNQESQNNSRFNKRKNKFIEDINKNVKYSLTIRSISHQLTRKNNQYIKSKEHKEDQDPSSQKREIKRSKSPVTIKTSKKETSFTSLSPKIKRRFGSVTVGKVVRKRAISRNYEKSPTVQIEPIKTVENPLRRYDKLNN